MFYCKFRKLKSFRPKKVLKKIIILTNKRSRIAVIFSFKPKESQKKDDTKTNLAQIPKRNSY